MNYTVEVRTANHGEQIELPPDATQWNVLADLTRDDEVQVAVLRETPAERGVA